MPKSKHERVTFTAGQKATHQLPSACRHHCGVTATTQLELWQRHMGVLVTPTAVACNERCISFMLRLRTLPPPAAHALVQISMSSTASRSNCHTCMPPHCRRGPRGSSCPFVCNSGCISFHDSRHCSPCFLTITMWPPAEKGEGAVALSEPAGNMSERANQATARLDLR